MSPSRQKRSAFAIVFASMVAATTLALVSLPSSAEEGARIPAIKHAATAKECSACHMAFQPEFLPSRSWEAIMTHLSDHFGEDASLPPEVAADITAYLVANSKEANGWTKRIPAGDTPLRITETPGWIGAHRGEVSETTFKSDKVKSKSNCMACHRAADKGIFGDD